MVNIVDQNSKLDQYAGPGHWNDPDMLEVGNNGMTDTEYRAHFSLWSIMAAPLIAGNDLRNMSDETKAILLNKDVIAVDQDSLGKQGKKISDDGDHEIFVKPLSNGDAAVVLFNRGSSSAKMSITAQELGLPASEAYLVRDLWQHIDKGSTNTISADVPSHGAAMFRVSPSTVDKVPASLDVSFSFNNYVEAGNSVKVITTFSNTGIKPVSSATASFQVPDGWTASSLSSTSFDSIPVGQSVNVDWNVTASANAAVGSSNLAATISYMDGTSERQQQGSTQITVVPTAPKNTTYLSDINWFYSSNGWGPVEKDMSVGESGANDGRKITLNGVSYEKGLGAHSPSEIYYNIGGNYAEFTSVVGLDDEVGSNGSVTFEVWGDGQKLWDSGLLKGNSDPVNVKVSIAGVKILKLVITNGGDNKDYDHADWADAMIKAYDYSGLTEPINNNGLSLFNSGSTIPVKFQLRDAKGIFVTNAIAKLYIARVTDNVAGEENEAVSTAVSDGNTFRYDSTSNQYIFNLNTKNLTAGTYQIRVDFGDGTLNTARIELR
jgi:alpha-galactosidase